ncbi:radical SAM protein [Scytonema hofmannii PCC 7110]|uniref:Radical SAM protein n=1 Tax=Scytonema hofmannii PCC 7110 TaxID=128403 RepID=A0A139X407_9CYAN|nr:radical SAM protein [Scytonema hofmannii]KYC39418.1 radical SAM protein [Scytonema hofmannii PCC 7110]
MTFFIKPKKIRLDAATVCQLNCPSCPTAQGEIKKTLRGGFLKFEDFKRLVDENPWLSHIELSNWGEIFLNADILKILEYSYQKNVSLSASNGVNLNTVSEEVLEGLVKYKFRKMSCSIDGASQETYEIYRRRGNFERVIDNLKKINHYKKVYNSKFPLIRWQFVIFGHNEHEIPIAKQLAKELNMELWLKLSWDESFSPIKDKEKIAKITGLGVASRSEYQEKYKINYMQKGICSQLWNEPQLNWDGRVLGCCFNHWSDFGNAFESSLETSLNNEKINYARQMLLGKKEERDDISCTQCIHYKAMKNHSEWLTMSQIRRASAARKLHMIADSLWIGRLGRLKVWLVNNFMNK